MIQFYNLTQQQIFDSYTSCEYFINNIYKASFTDKDQFNGGKHINEWANMFQRGNSCIISARKHSKSYTMYGYLMWLIWKNVLDDLEVLYVSYKEQLAKYHIWRLKQKIRENPYFRDLKDFTPKNVEGIAKYSWDGIHKITITPGGVLSFGRGKHPDVLILDDVLADPTDQLNLSTVYKVNQRIREVALSMPKEGGVFQAIGTAQSQADFLFEFKKAPHINWGLYPAITNWKEKKVLWPEMFNWGRLMQIREHETGHKGFDKEYQCVPIWSADSFFKKEDIELTM